jgi:signal transduction histidine kinase
MKIFKIEGNEEVFFQIKRLALNEVEEDTFMIQIVNITQTVNFKRTSKENELLALINATVSHEMRNPLNSICA